MITNYSKLREIFGDHSHPELIETDMFREILGLIAEAERAAGEKCWVEMRQICQERRNG